MASEGMFFTHNCVTTSVCMVSRASLYTGQYASRHRTFKSYENVTMYRSGKWNQTLFPVLKAGGYYTGLVGKYHHSMPPPKDVPAFDVLYNLKHSHFVHDKTLPVAYKGVRNGTTKHITQWDEELSMEFLQKRPLDKPFALAVSFFATHAMDGAKGHLQYQPMNSSMHLHANESVPRPTTYTKAHFEKLPKKIFTHGNFNVGRSKKRYKCESDYQMNMKNTYRMATEVDTVAGRLMDELERQGVLNSTLVIFTTDNGNLHGQHGLAEKWIPLEESMRVPLIVMDPRMPRERQGKQIDEYTLNVDLAPTILSAAGISIPDVMQGRDIAELYLSDKAQEVAEGWRKEFLYEYEWPEEIKNIGVPHSLALVRKDAKLVSWPQFSIEQMYDMANDPLEENDVFNLTDKAKLQEMRSRMKELQEAAIAGAKV